MAKDSGNWFVWLVIIGAIIVGVFMFQGDLFEQKTLKEHEKPADISEEEAGTGLNMSFYDCPDSVLEKHPKVVPRDVLKEECRKIEIPDWFSTGSTISLTDTLSIVKRTSPPACSVDSDCSTTNPDIMCWNSQCVIGNVNTIPLSIGVTNPSTSEIPFSNIAPSTASPIEFDSAIDKTAVDLSPGNSHSFSAPGIVITSFEGQTKTFSVTVEGTNEYTGGTYSTGDSIKLVIESDPTGTFSVTVQSPI